MNRVSKFFVVLVVGAMVACGEPEAEIVSEGSAGQGTGVAAQVMPLEFQDDCASWNGGSVKVSMFADHWTIDSFSAEGCADTALFEQRYELDSEFLGVWKQTFVIEVGSADADREIYLLDPESGDRIGELWYVGEPLFADSGITYYEPTREEAKLDQCPQKLDEVKQWAEQGAVIMYSSKKTFDLESRSTYSLSEKGCYAMR